MISKSFYDLLLVKLESIFNKYFGNHDVTHNT